MSTFPTSPQEAIQAALVRVCRAEVEGEGVAIQYAGGSFIKRGTMKHTPSIAAMPGTFAVEVFGQRYVVTIMVKESRR